MTTENKEELLDEELNDVESAQDLCADDSMDEEQPENGVYIDLQIAVADTKNLPTAKELQKYAEAAILPRKPYAEMTVRIVEEDESHELDLEYRGKDRPTNVLSFPFEYPEELPKECYGALIGDLVICKAVVEREALEQHKPLAAHWAHMIVHGSLHLLGYDHITDEEAAIMEPLETQTMLSLGFEDPYKDDEI